MERKKTNKLYSIKAFSDIQNQVKYSQALFHSQYSYFKFNSWIKQAWEIKKVTFGYVLHYIYIMCNVLGQ